jgi:hypothetical protein
MCAAKVETLQMDICEVSGRLGNKKGYPKSFYMLRALEGSQIKVPLTFPCFTLFQYKERLSAKLSWMTGSPKEKNNCLQSSY